MFARENFEDKRLYDRERFPYGIARSGDFSIEEATFLEKRGAFYKALFDGQISNPNEDDVRIINIALGKVEAKSFEEKAWQKYINYKGRAMISLSELSLEIAESVEAKGSLKGLGASEDDDIGSAVA